MVSHIHTHTHQTNQKYCLNFIWIWYSFLPRITVKWQMIWLCWCHTNNIPNLARFLQRHQPLFSLYLLYSLKYQWLLLSVVTSSIDTIAKTKIKTAILMLTKTLIIFLFYRLSKSMTKKVSLGYFEWFWKFHILFFGQNFSKTPENREKNPLGVCCSQSVQLIKLSAVMAWFFLGYRKQYWEVEELRWCDGIVNITSQMLAPVQGS